MSDLRPNIWRLQAQGDSKALIAALQNADPDVRKRAVAALHVLGAVEAIPALRRLLQNEADDDTRMHIVVVLDDLMQEQQKHAPQISEQTHALISQLKSGDPAAIIAAANGLGKLKDRTAVEALVLIFHNAQLPGKVRLSAAEALLALESAPAVVTLLAALKNDSWKIRRNATAVLGQLRADWAIARLADRLGDESAHVQRTARAALQRIGTPEAQQALAAYRHSEQPKAKSARLTDSAPTEQTTASDAANQTVPPKPPATLPAD